MGSGETWPTPRVLDEIRGSLGGRGSNLGLVLGSGLGSLADRLDDPWSRDGSQIEGYPRSSVEGHAGRLLLGRLAGRMVWVVQGRVHLYEGHAPDVVTRYVRLLHALGVRTLILTNAAGALTRELDPGDICLDRDAINLFFRSFACGAAAPWRRRGALTDPGLARLALQTANDLKIPLRQAVLAAATGPAYETGAEVRAWRRLGGTVASMSTVPEALVARELGIRCLLFSLVTNLATGLSPRPLLHDDVVREGNRWGERLARLLFALLPRID